MQEETPELRFGGRGGTIERSIVETRPVEVTTAPVQGAVKARLMVGSEDLGAPEVRLGRDEWRWEWHPRGRVGTFPLRLTVEQPGTPSRVWEYTFVVEPSRLEQEHYRRLLAAIQRTASGLVYTLGGGGTGARLVGAAAGPSSLLAEYWTRVRAEVDLARAITLDLARQHLPALHAARRDQGLAELAELPLAGLARAVEGELDELDHPVAAPLHQFLPASPTGKARVPRSLPVTTMAPTNATYEHRLLLRLIDELSWRCDFIRHELARELVWRTNSAPLNAQDDLRDLQTWSDQIGGARRILDRCRSAEFLAGLLPGTWQGFSERMRRDARYRRLGELWRMIHAAPFLAFHSPAFDLPVRDLPALYEQWCLLEVAAVLCSTASVEEQQVLVAEQHSGAPGQRMAWRVRLLENRPLLRVRHSGGEELILWYQRRFRANEGLAGSGSLDPFLRIPDIVVELHRPGKTPALLVFDAKYRVAPDGAIPEEALGDAYTYHAALGYAGERVARGVFLLFPGTSGFERGSVGALPLLPGQTDPLRTVVDRFVCGAFPRCPD